MPLFRALALICLITGAVTRLSAEEPPAAPASSPAAPLTLEKACERALASDESIEIALLEIRKTRRERWSALTRLGPDITASFGLEQLRERRDLRTDRPPVVFDSFTRTGERSDASRAQLIWQQTLFDFSALPAWRQGRLSVEIATLRRRYTIRQTLFGVTQAYYAVLKQERVTAIARETLTLARHQRQQAGHRLEFGDAARTDVLGSEASLQSARRALIEAESALDQSRFSLLSILHLDPAGEPPVLVEPPAAPEPAGDYLQLTDTALARREDYLASLLTVDQGRERRREVAAGYAPRLVGQASYDWADLDSNRSNSDEQLTWSAAVAVQVPLFTGGQREIDLGRTRIAIRQADLESSRLARSIREEVHAASLDVKTLRESIAALEAESAASEKHHAALTTGYESGVATNIDVLVALRDLNQVRLLLTSARYDYQVALCNLERAQSTFASEWVRPAGATPGSPPPK